MFHTFSKKNTTTKTDIRETDRFIPWGNEESERLRGQYQKGMESILPVLQQTKQEDEKSKIILFFMEMLKIDIFGSYLTHILFAEDNNQGRNNKQTDKGIPRFPEIKHKKETTHETFCQSDNSKYKRILYPELGIIRVQEGQHHLAAASVKAQGTIDISVCELSPCFSFFYTDGAYWINGDTGEKQLVLDIRFALLYGLAQKIWEENGREAAKPLAENHRSEFFNMIWEEAKKEKLDEDICSLAEFLPLAQIAEDLHISPSYIQDVWDRNNIVP